ncbi:MAG: LysR family transcriptional regulator [Gammaproteobacteria bacterium]|jgi:LysR family transcriptional regulator, low CO2-responsive transcriptional regulator
MMRVTLRQLRTFEAVARLKSFSGAAEEMHVSQPTVSKQIKSLHEAIGLPLLEQIGKKVFLTDAGNELYATCAEWLNTWGRFEQTIADLKGMKQGKLKIAAVTTTKYFMPRLLGPFCAQYPGIDISLEVLNRDRLLERMARNEDDLYIMGVPPEGMDVDAEPFLDNPLVVLAPASHPLAQRKRIPFKALGNETFLMRERGSGTRMTIERLFAERNTPLNVKMELGSNEAIKQAIAGGLGLAVLSQSTLSLEPMRSELTILDVQGFPLMRAWYMVRPKGKPSSVVVQTFREFLREHVELLVPRL